MARRPLSEKQQAALAAGRAKAREMREAGILAPGGKGGGMRRTDREPEPDTGPRAVVVTEVDPAAPAVAPAEPPKTRRITWPTPPTPKSAAPVTADADANGPYGAGPAPAGVPSTDLPPSPLPTPTPEPTPRRGFLAGLLEGFSQ